jgi:hypothetical protein
MACEIAVRLDLSLPLASSERVDARKEVKRKEKPSADGRRAKCARRIQGLKIQQPIDSIDYNTPSLGAVVLLCLFLCVL